MQKYTDVVFSSTGTSAVAPLPLATVTVAYAAGGTPTLYSDNGVTVLSNPFTSDANGRISFYAADGRYTLTVSKTGYATVTISDILLEDPSNPNPISATTITATGTSTLAGVTATSLAVSGAATATALNVTGALSATGALTTNGLKEDSSGGLGIGGATSGIESLRLLKNMTGSVNAIGIYNVGTVQSDVTTGAWYYRTYAATQAATFTLPQLIHYSTVQGTIGAGSTVTTQIGFEANGTLTGATNNYGFYGALSYATGRYNFYAAGTAPNRFVGETLVIGAAGLGYGTGAGGTVTQATSKATAVTLNKPTGQITMTADSLAAGASISFQFNNSLISAVDTLIVNIVWSTVSPPNYIVRAGVGVGAANIILKNDSAGALAEAVQINFAIIKGATA